MTIIDPKCTIESTVKFFFLSLDTDTTIKKISFNLKLKLGFNSSLTHFNNYIITKTPWLYVTTDESGDSFLSVNSYWNSRATWVGENKKKRMS